MLRSLLLMCVTAVACASRPAAAPAAGAESAPAPASSPAVAAANRTWADTARPLATLDRGWNRIPGREGTGCAEETDTTFVFRVRPGVPDKVLIFLNGGGMCWKGADCDPRGKPTYTTNADSANDASVRSGIFDVNNDANPFREYTMIFVSYCTGDAHVGSRTVEYESKGRTFSIRHIGNDNVEGVLDWLYSTVRHPRTVFVAGMDAGAIASPVVAAKVARHYPRARVVQLGDGAGALRSNPSPEPFASWYAPYTFERLYATAARTAPRVRYAQVNYIDDATQAAQLVQLGVKGQAVSKLLTANLQSVRGSIPSFRSYSIPGRAHTILRSAALYTTKVDGVAFTEWLSSLADGEMVQDVAPKAAAKPKA